MSGAGRGNPASGRVEDRWHHILEADGAFSNEDLQAALLKSGLSCSGGPSLQDGDLRLVELTGFLSEDDPRLTALTEAEPAITRFWLAGSYARPLKIGTGQQRQGAD